MVNKYDSLKTLNELSGNVINAAMEVHTYHGPGLLESMYVDSLVIELNLRDIKVETEVSFPVSYKGVPLNKRKTVDMIIENAIVVEAKTVDMLLPVHESQLLTYLKISDCRLGLLLNFKTEHLKDGIKRVLI